MKNLLKYQGMMRWFTTGDLLDFLYYQKYYRFIGIYLYSPQIDFMGKLEGDNSATMILSLNCNKKQL